MSDLTEAASAALGIPTALVERSAAARAAENNNDVGDILAAWAGGGAAPSASPPTTVETEAQPELVPVESEERQSQPLATATVAVVSDPAPQSLEPVPEYEPETQEPLEPVALGTRLRTAVRIGAWTGAGLGLIGFFMAAATWAPNAAALPDSGPVVQVDSTSVLLRVTLVSILFGAIVASLSRAGASWSNPGMQLSSSKSTTAWIGAAAGLMLGLIAGAALTGGFGTPVEGAEGVIQLPVLATLAVTLIGGAVLGAVTAAVPQLLGTPVAVGEVEEGEIETVKNRLGGALSVPMAAGLLLVLLVLPFGYMLIQSNHLGANGAAIVAILTAGGILGFAALAGGKPEMRISFGEMLVAVAGIGTVLLIILAVLFYTGQDADHGAGEEEVAEVVLIV